MGKTSAENYRSRCDAIISRFKKEESIIGVEVGVQNGRMATRMMGYEKVVEYWCVDPWRAYDGYEKTSVRTHKYIFHNFLQRAALFTEKVRILTVSSVVAAGIFKPETFDFVFIDGNHEYPYVGEDILVWGPLVKYGGWLCGHDYDRKGCEGVKQAVDEIFPNVVIGTNNIWMIQI